MLHDKKMPSLKDKHVASQDRSTASSNEDNITNQQTTMDPNLEQAEQNLANEFNDDLQVTATPVAPAPDTETFEPQAPAPAPTPTPADTTDSTDSTTDQTSDTASA